MRSVGLMLVATGGLLVASGCTLDDPSEKPWQLEGKPDVERPLDVEQTDSLGADTRPGADGGEPDTVPFENGEEASTKPEIVASRRVGGYNWYGIAKYPVNRSYCAILLFGSQYQQRDVEFVDLQADFPFNHGEAVIQKKGCSTCPFNARSEHSLEVESVEGTIQKISPSDSTGLTVTVDVQLKVAEPPEGIPKTIQVDSPKLTFGAAGVCGP